MGHLSRTNAIRKRLTNALTKGVGKTSAEGWDTAASKADIKKVLICRPNHRLGNLLLITPLVQEVQELYPEAKIDLFVKGGLAPTLFRNYENVDRIIQLPRKPFSDLLKYLKGWLRLQSRTYDLVINVDSKSSSGRLSTKYARGKHKLFGEVREETSWKPEDREHFGKGPVCSLRSYMKPGSGKRQFPFLDLRLTSQELAEGKRILEKMEMDGRKTICLFTYATGAKRYSEAWWTDFHEQISAELPEYQFVEVLPIENVSQLSFRLPTFYSKDVREIAAFIANTVLFIGADSGITHLASAADTPTIALFSVTSELKYRPYNKNSSSLDTNYLKEKNLAEILQNALNKERSQPAPLPSGASPIFQLQ